MNLKKVKLVFLRINEKYCNKFRKYANFYENI